ncbi:MAG TPA: DUF2199 domain-containing protein [Steroidobacteraceae bacterium]
MNETIDPRWILLQNSTWACSSCGDTHRSMFDLGCAKPDFWQGSEDPLPNSIVAGSANCLTEDFCILDGEHYFIRCVLRLPLIGAPSGEYFSFGVWSSLSKKNFTVYTETFDSGAQEELGPWFGWFSNRLKGYPDTLNLKCQVYPQAARQRPWIELENTGHPLATDACEGISYERLLEIYAAYGHTWASAVS